MTWEEAMADSIGRPILISIVSGKTEFIIPASIYNRAKRGKKRGAKIRRPIEKKINGELLVFTEKEWQRVWEGPFCKSIRDFLKEEIQERVMNSKKVEQNAIHAAQDGS